MNVEDSVLALQELDVEMDDLSLCLSIASTTSTTSSWPTLKTK